ncbi:DUF7551 domain-containing protein [Halobaculum sp. EA56]|uniref:DUF7551 domain-containing protein n=1 Tax=Halobaculum sp. EA56 TaxID=3421648 RepID=UPI003EC0F82B
MIGTTLGDLRRHIESLADPDGDYRLVCARTGDRPVPADGLAFDGRATARAAARSTEQYRAALRRYDPQLPVYDVIACQVTEDVTSPGRAVDGTEPGPGPRQERPEGNATARSAIDYCHTVAGVVFEAIADSPHTALQDAIMDTYLESAEELDGPDDLCLRLLRSIAAELSARLESSELTDVLRAAGERMPDSEAEADDPVAAALAELESAGMLRSYEVSAPSVDIDAAARRWRVEFEGYALADDDRVVTLPVVVALFRRASVRSIAIASVERSGEGRWTLALTTNGGDGPTGLTSVRPRS